MTCWVWGNTVHGELGLGGIEEDSITNPRQLIHDCSKDIEQVACGISHTLWLTREGQVFSCGNNDHGQLGHESSWKKPNPISALSDHQIKQVSCGASHSLALTEWGQVYAWGSNSHGQLGQEFEGDSPVPRIVKPLVTKHVVQIACGHNHCLALTNAGELYSWGANQYGQLGFGYTSETVPKPILIASLVGLPVAFITCGGNHSVILSRSGAVFAWGKNTFGQLGVQDYEQHLHPTQLRSLRSIGVKYISCGDDFTMFLTMDGGVFTCGLGAFGQLGHGQTRNEALPKMVAELMGSKVTQVACGRRHALAFIGKRVYGFGLGANGQLGVLGAGNPKVPQVVVGPWIKAVDEKVVNGENRMDVDGEGSSGAVMNAGAWKVLKIFAGGDQSIAFGCDEMLEREAEDYRVYSPSSQILTLNIELTSTCSEIPAKDPIDQEMLGTIEVIFKHPACLNGSFLVDPEKHTACTSTNHGIDLDIAESTFEYIRKIENKGLMQLIRDSVTGELLKSLTSSPAHVEALRVYLILPLFHEFANAKNNPVLHSPFSEAVLRLAEIPQRILRQWWAAQSVEYFERLVVCFKEVVTYVIHYNFKTTGEQEKTTVRYEKNLLLALRFLRLLYEINHVHRKQRVPYEAFTICDLTENVDIQRDYISKLLNKDVTTTFHLCDFPFIFDVAAKTLLLQTDQHLQMQQAVHNAQTQLSFMDYLMGNVNQFMVLNVTRENLVADTIREIRNYSQKDFKKPLKVKICGEEAEDAGGVRKEFFMLLLREILDPKYGMFKEFEDSRQIWFSDMSFEGEEMYGLIGFLCGLAIYNFTIINLPFPLALYKKILGEPVDITDLKDLMPTIGKSMQQLMDYEGDDLADVFAMTFSITRDVYGEVRTEQLKPNGDEILVTQENKREFLDLYIDHVFNKAVEGPFKHFLQYFHGVCGGHILNLFRPNELMAIVVGNDDYDWEALENSAEYKNGFSSGDVVIQWFWEVLHALPLDEKKKFLLFLTGSDRCPVQGMKAIKIIIQPATDDRYLPVAHTCFNLLDLPRYSTKEKLRYKLQQAIQQTQGFSLV